MFPIDISGSIRLRNLGNTAPYVAPVRERLVDLLDEANGSDVTAEGDAVRFKMPFFGGAGRYHPLASIDTGTFQIETEDTALHVRYRLSTLRLLIVITLPLALLFGLVMFGGTKPRAWQSMIEIMAIGWLWVFGINYLISAIRIPFWLKRKLKDVAK